MKFISWALALMTQTALAAPYPLTGSSLYLDTQKNLFLIPFGFSLNLEKSKIRLLLNQNDQEKWTFDYPGTDQLFTMRFRNFKSESEYAKSLKIWVREYQKSGLKIVDKNIRSQAPKKGWIHLEDPNGKQILQYFTFVDLTWVYFGCVGLKSETQKLHQTCDFLNSQVKNQID